MGLGRSIHHIGSFLLLAATVLLVIVDITAPVVNDISLLKVDLSNSAGSNVKFGTFGYCVISGASNGRDACSKSQIGYNPAAILRELDGTTFSDISEDTPKALTRVLVLNPVATGLCFIAFLLCLGAGFLGSLLAAVVSFIAFLVTLVSLICAFVGFGIVKHKVNDQHSNGHAKWGIAIWLLLASAICSLIATVVVFITCCTGRSKKHRETKQMSEYNDSAPLYPRKRHFWQRR